MNPSRALRRGVLTALLFVFPLVVVAGCGSDSSNDASPSASTSAGTSLVGPQWSLTDGASLGVSTTGVAVTAEFADGRMTGSSGCNSYGAPYTVRGDAMTVGPQIGSTAMACAPARAAVEQAYLARLPRVRSYAISGKTLTLRGADNASLLVYDAVDGAKAIVGNWTATSYYSGNAIESVAPGSTLTADFEADTVSGNGGCNSFHGPYTLSGKTITIGPLASTMMACTDPALQTQEQRYLAALELARSYRLTGTRLDLLRPGGTIAATFEAGSTTG